MKMRLQMTVLGMWSGWKIVRKRKKEECVDEVGENTSEGLRTPNAEMEPSVKEPKKEPGIVNLSKNAAVEDNLTNNIVVDEEATEADNQTENSEKPSIHSEEPSDKYQLWEARTKFLKDPDL